VVGAEEVGVWPVSTEELVEGAAEDFVPDGWGDTVLLSTDSRSAGYPTEGGNDAEAEGAIDKGFSSLLCLAGVSADFLVAETLAALDCIAGLSLGCIINKPKQKTATNINGIPIINPRISSFCSICNVR
jgi:hypothetical protein